jgi:spore coat polysaccharide biosynthesis protein SpsF
MSERFKTDQEEFWAGKFGDDYIARNGGDALLGSNISFLAKMLNRCPQAKSLIEFGANIGMNLRGIRALRPQMELDAIEINAMAVDELRAWGGAKQIYHQSVLDFQSDRTWDIAFIKGVLIHINPDFLPQVYESLFRASGRYILVVEYYNPTPVEINYRGHSGKLFKRDFAGEMLDKFPSLRVVDYGFVWKRDPVFPQDDLTWFVLEKNAR